MPLVVSPAGHAVQVVAPEELVKVFTAQSSQEDCAAWSWNSPGEQSVHALDPMLSAKLPAWQSAQVALPVEPAKVPTAQSTQLD